MPAVSREKVKSMLSEIPPEQHEAALARMAERGYVLAPDPVSSEGTEPQGVDWRRSLLTNEETSGLGEDLLRGTPAGLAAAAGLKAGGIPGAVVFGAAAEAARQDIAAIYAAETGKEGASPAEVAGRVVLAGATQAIIPGAQAGLGKAAATKIGRAAVAGAGKAWEATKTGAVKFGGQLLQATQGTPAKYGEAIVRGLTRFAKTKEEVGAGYNAFAARETPPLKSLKTAALDAEVPEIPGWFARKKMREAYYNLVKGGDVSTEALFQGSQGARVVKDIARLGDPKMAASLGNINQMKGAIEKGLEIRAPGYANLRFDTYLSKAAERAEPWLPQTKSMAPSAARVAVGYALGQKAYEKEDPRYLIPLALVSPRVTAGAINFAYNAGGFVQAQATARVLQPTAQAAASPVAQALLEMYMRPNR